MDGGVALYGLRGGLDLDATTTNGTASDYINYEYGLRGDVDCDDTIDTSSTGYVGAYRYGVYSYMDIDTAFTDTGTNSPANRSYNYGIYSNLNGTPTISGSATVTTYNYGIYVAVNGNTEGTSYNYGLYLAGGTDADTNYGIFDNSGYDWAIDSDNALLRFGEDTGDLDLYSDGTDGQLDATADIDIHPATKTTLGDGGTTNYLSVSATGDQTFVGSGGLVFGSCYGNSIGWSQASAVQNTWYEIVDADMADGPLNNCTHDGNGAITVTEPGMYLCSYTLNVTSSVATQHIQAVFSVNDTETSAGMNDFLVIDTASEKCISGTAILDLADNATVEVSVRTTDSGTPNIGVQHLNIAVTQVGGT
jgi:hypothetical protein